MKIMKIVGMRGAKKFQDRTTAERYADDLGGSVEPLRILDGLQIREVYVVAFPYDSQLRFARRAQYKNLPCYLAAGHFHP